jgi:hypothetical protein
VSVAGSVMAPIDITSIGVSNASDAYFRLVLGEHGMCYIGSAGVLLPDASQLYLVYQAMATYFNDGNPSMSSSLIARKTLLTSDNPVPKSALMECVLYDISDNGGLSIMPCALWY